MIDGSFERERPVGKMPTAAELFSRFRRRHSQLIERQMATHLMRTAGLDIT